MAYLIVNEIKGRDTKSCFQLQIEMVCSITNWNGLLNYKLIALTKLI